MANPNRVFANMSKAPWVLEKEVRTEVEAEEVAQRLRAEGKKARVKFVQGRNHSFSASGPSNQPTIHNQRKISK
jgi:acetyl esterase/lipase